MYPTVNCLHSNITTIATSSKLIITITIIMDYKLMHHAQHRLIVVTYNITIIVNNLIVNTTIMVFIVDMVWLASTADTNFQQFRFNNFKSADLQLKIY